MPLEIIFLYGVWGRAAGRLTRRAWTHRRTGPVVSGSAVALEHTNIHRWIGVTARVCADTRICAGRRSALVVVLASDCRGLRRHHTWAQALLAYDAFGVFGTNLPQKWRFPFKLFNKKNGADISIGEARRDGPEVNVTSEDTPESDKYSSGARHLLQSHRSLLAEVAGPVLRRTVLPAARGAVVGSLALGLVASIAFHLALGAVDRRIVLRQTQQRVRSCCALRC